MKIAIRLRRLRLRFIIWNALARGDCVVAVAALDRLDALCGLSPVEEAELATALLRSGRADAAQRRFASLQKKMGGDAEERYVQKYCRYYLALMRDERSQAAYEWRLAQTIDAPLRSRKRLPMEPVREKARPGVVATLSHTGMEH
jgi:hypothetical protein